MVEDSLLTDYHEGLESYLDASCAQVSLSFLSLFFTLLTILFTYRLLRTATTTTVTHDDYQHQNTSETRPQELESVRRVSTLDTFSFMLCHSIINY